MELLQPHLTLQNILHLTHAPQLGRLVLSVSIFSKLLFSLDFHVTNIEYQGMFQIMLVPIENNQKYFYCDAFRKCIKENKLHC